MCDVRHVGLAAVELALRADFEEGLFASKVGVLLHKEELGSAATKTMVKNIIRSVFRAEQRQRLVTG